MNQIWLRHKNGGGKKFGNDCEVSADSFMDRKSSVGDSVEIYSSQIIESVISDDVIISNAYIHSSTIKDQCRLIGSGAGVNVVNSDLSGNTRIWGQAAIMDVTLENARVYGSAILQGPWELREFVRIHRGTWRKPPRYLLIEDDNIDVILSECVKDHFHLGCVLPGATVEGSVEKAMKTFYSGNALEITTRSGKRLRVTPNHPVATEQGFIPAESLQQNIKLLSYKSNVEFLLGSHNVDYGPTVIEKIFETVAMVSFVTERRGVSATDFHGDGSLCEGDVEIVSINRKLPFIGESVDRETVSDLDLVSERMGLGNVAPLGTLNSMSLRLPLSFFGFPRAETGLANRVPVSGRTVAQSLPLEPLRFGLPSQMDARRPEPPGESAARDAAFLGELLHGHPGLVLLDEIIEIRDFHYDGPVYDLQSPNGWIVANGVLISNCWCLPRETWFRKGYRQMLGKRSGWTPAQVELAFDTFSMWAT